MNSATARMLPNSDVIARNHSSVFREWNKAYDRTADDK
jgi:hypothetical protein